MVDVVETTLYIRVQNIFALETDIVEDCSSRIMGIASRSETVAIGLE